ncbi:TonB-dependent receptor plug domain-containing protein [Dyella sp.]|jgi:outer membrane receptor protein involved in Fe transport|uniref:TonB-dependent receptor plug domain-containing protein n=1 Tax=Dyella sp. TaxID=1869338 RepID=UPI002D781097|nr:TonB-dependent receptor [Dyella sp.]HET6431893.1 TonB-dependent receptor [Dyella sp.]
MNTPINKMTAAVRTSLTVGAVLAAGFAMPAFAQDAAQPQSADQKDATTLQTITVTGSHIRRVDLETSNPVVTIDAAQIKATGKLTLGDIVQQLPAVTGGNVNPQVNNAGGTGGSSIGLRGLGSQRTLVLIDGKRIINTDPNSIPADMIERIEVLTDGASSVYGSDAIGGVVNFILKKDYQGAQFTVNYGQSSHADGRSKGYTFTFGQTSDKGSIMGGVDYNKTEAVLAKNRDFSKNSVSIYGSSQTPIYSYIGGSSFPAYGNIQLPTQYQAQYGCTNVALNPGASGQNIATDYHCFTNADKYNYATVNLIQTPQERTSLWLKGTYDLGEHVQAYMDAYHNKTSSGFQLAPALLGSLYGAVISADSYYNPFGEEYSSAGLDYRARLVSAGNRAANFGTTTDQIHTGFKGDFTLLDHDWNWDVGMGYGHFSQQTITRGLPNQDKINAALGPSFLDTDGTVKCGTPGDVISGCTPFNPFNLFDPNSVAALQAVAVPAISNQFNIERTYSADVNGGLFDLPAGTVQIAGGLSYRKEYTRSEIDPLLLIDPATGNCTLGSQCSSPLRGGYNVKEAYAEVFVPVLSDMPFAQALNITIGDRYSKYSTFGSTNNTKFAVEYRPITDLLLRGTVSEVFRAPTIGDVYGAPISDAPKLSSDPCDGITTAGNPACVGVPTDGSFQDKNVALGQQIKGVTSGSQYAGFPLGPEQGKSFDVGFVYSPNYVQGLSLSADFWHLYLNDTISAIGAQTVLDLCYNGATQYCPLISRFPTGSANPGEIAQIVEPTGNLGRTDVSGVDFSARYKLPEFSFGNFVVGLDATYLSRYDQQTAPGTDANTTFHDAGHFQPFGSSQASTCPSGGGVCLFPRWRGNSFVNWNMGDWSASWRMRYIGAFRNGSLSPSQDTNPVQGLPGVQFKYGATIYNDVSVGYNYEPLNTRVDLGVNNLFDKQPPFLYANNTLNANTDPSDFDLQGRYYWARVTVSF